MEWQSLEQHEIDSNGVRIRYRLGGNSCPLVLLHGSPQTSFAWRKIVPLIAPERLIVVPDLRGYGDSDRPHDGYSIGEMVQDLRQLIKALGLGSVDIVGHDLGGIVAYAYAAQYASEVRKLGVIEAPIIGVPSKTLDPVLASYWHFGFYAHPELPELLIKGREKAYLAEFFRTYSFIDAIEDSAIEEYARHVASLGGIRGMTGVYREILSWLPALSELQATRITTPVWAVGGDRSMGMGIYEQFQQLSDTVKGGVIRNSGHWVIEEQPRSTAAALLEFLDE